MTKSSNKVPTTSTLRTHEPADPSTLGREHRSAEVDRPRCSARSSRTGKPCRKYPVAGAVVCRSHGGAAPQVQKAARRRLEQAADVLVQRLLGIALDGTAPDQVALSAVLGALDRAGLSVKSTLGVEVAVKPWEQIADEAFSTVEAGSRDEYRAARGGQPTTAAIQPALPWQQIAEPDTFVDAEILSEEPLPFGNGERRESPFDDDSDAGGMMSFEDAVSAQAEIRRQTSQVRRQLPPGRSTR